MALGLTLLPPTKKALFLAPCFRVGGYLRIFASAARIVARLRRPTGVVRVHTNSPC